MRSCQHMREKRSRRCGDEQMKYSFGERDKCWRERVDRVVFLILFGDVTLISWTWKRAPKGERMCRQMLDRVI